MLAAVSPLETIRDDSPSDFILLGFFQLLKQNKTKTRYTLKPQKPLEVFGDAKTHFVLNNIQLFNECFQYLTTVLPSIECSVSHRGDTLDFLNSLFLCFFKGEGEGLLTG